MYATDSLEISLGGEPASERDPVCGARVDSASAPASEVYGGRTFYFCSRSCHERFTANPEPFASRLTGPG